MTSSEKNNEAEVSLDWISRVFFYKFQIAAWTILCVLVSFVFVMSTPPEFYASATIILDPRRRTPLPADSLDATQTNFILDNAQADSQMQVIKSERVLNSVFDKLQLAKSSEFKDNESSGLMPYIYKTVKKTDNINERDSSSFERRSFLKFSSRINVRRIGQSYVIEVGYRARQPDDAAKIANAIVLQYIKNQIELKSVIAQGLEYLQNRTVSIKQQLAAADDGIKEGRIPGAPFPDADAQVIGAAVAPLGKSYPQNTLILSFGFFLGVLSGSFIALLYSSLSGRIVSTAQIAKILEWKIVASVKNIPSTRNFTQNYMGEVATSPEALHDPKFLRSLRGVRVYAKSSILNDRNRYGTIAVIPCSERSRSGSISLGLAYLCEAMNDGITLIDLRAGKGRLPQLLNIEEPHDPISGAEISELSSGMKKIVITERFDFYFVGSESKESIKVLQEDVARIETQIDNSSATRITICNMGNFGEMPEIDSLISNFDLLLIVIDKKYDRVGNVLSTYKSVIERKTPVIGLVVLEG